MQFFKHIVTKNLNISLTIEYLVTRKMSTTPVKVLDYDSLLARCRQLPPPLSQDKHKGQAGRIGVFGGSPEYTGAPYYSAITSLKVGADLVYVFCMKDAATVIKAYSPDLIVLPYLDHREAESKIEPWINRLHAVLIGPGLGRDESTFSVIRQVITICKRLQKPMVIDADGLFLLSNNTDIIRDYPAKLIITPNVMEFSRLVGNTEEGKHRENCDKLFKICPNLTILRKGLEDIIFDSKAEVKVFGSGSGRRSGGQGDLLAGSVATFLVWALQKQSPVERGTEHDDRALLAAFAGCKLVRECNRFAFDKFGRSMTAVDMTEEIHGVFEYYFGE